MVATLRGTQVTTVHITEATPMTVARRLAGPHDCPPERVSLLIGISPDVITAGGGTPDVPELVELVIDRPGGYHLSDSVFASLLELLPRARVKSVDL